MTSEIDDISENLKTFVTTYIDSVEQLQVLTLLFEDTGKTWTVNEITKRLRSVESSIAKRLDDLYMRRILQRNPPSSKESRYDLIQPEFRDVINELVTIYKNRPYKIVELIYDRPKSTKS